MTDFNALADRVQALTSACRETDALIIPLIGWKLIAGMWFGPDGRGKGFYPSPTASRDAAMTLRLDWMSIETCESAAPASSFELQFTRCRIWDWRRGPLAIDRTNEWKAEGNRPLPLNMCAAILRARAALENSHG